MSDTTDFPGKAPSGSILVVIARRRSEQCGRWCGRIANSAYLWIAHLLLALVFVVAPLTEEPWLEEQYGEAYREYRKRVPRFL